ncbi:hypothetical protein B0J13DRAFT_32373 [Dactylonectria estremocensis]|uniref:Uncharacterized protein n=1 Tax=Dactylonectria estremocensis TaxID=1079267 RepID=A0A9P9FKQ0_9HYPO|nr:hypothetical protein B0J13DRAFT_32373 [Dactylonectria estremocensis]
MGNCCGKTESDAFDQPGRVLGSAPPQGSTSAPVPKVGGPPRVLGGSSTAEASGNQEDARRKASEAALARAKASSAGSGKLQAQLTSQQKKSHLEHLNDASKTKRGENQSSQDTEIQRWD